MTMMKIVPSLFLLLIGGSNAFLAKTSSFVPKSSCLETQTSSRGGGGSQKLSMSLKPLYDEMSSTVINRLALQATDFADTYQAKSWNAGSSSGSADWYAESSPQYLTGVSLCSRANQNVPAEEFIVNVWMGPSYDVPHMLLMFGAQGNGQYYIKADYVPRGATVFGSDPQYIENYYGQDVAAAWSEAFNYGGYALPPPFEFETRILDSPIKINVGGLDEAQVTALARGHLDRFLSWIDRAQPVPARSRGSFNLRDDKLRQYYFRGQLAKQVRELGPDLGQTVAAVNTGPTAEAYVGGGS